ncbi:hypothetical protein DV736_g2446, partial [Chaetothyriales sp. CBS 134916]
MVPNVNPIRQAAGRQACRGQQTEECLEATTTRSTRQPRRLASHDAGHGNGNGHGGHGQSALHIPGGSGNESLGPSFYLILASIPAFYAVYAFTNSKGENVITRFLDRYQARGGAESVKNAANVAIVQKALDDRSLFNNAETDYSVDLRFPEQFNVGSPINVIPGESRANLEELRAFYSKKYKAAEERRLAKVKDGKVILVDDRPDTKEIEARLGRTTK